MDLRCEILDIAEYIRAHVYDELAWEDLAAKAYLSKYHFHRMFSNVMGIPAARFIREQKLRCAYALLVNSGESVTDIGYALGFSSQDVFTRAFRRLYGKAPGEVRKAAVGRRFLQRRLRLQFLLNNKKGSVGMYEMLLEERNGAFTLNEKREALKTVEFMVKMAEAAHAQGVLALEDMAMKEADTLFVKKGISLICDGTEPELVKKFLSDFLFSSNFKGADLLKRIISLEGMLMIQSGTHSKLIRDGLLLMLGEDFYEEACSYFGVKAISTSEDNQAAIEAFFRDAPDADYPEGTNLLEDLILGIDDRAIQYILREMNNDDLYWAFYGSSKKVRRKIVDNLSEYMAIQVINFCRAGCPPDVGYIIKTQHNIHSIYHKLIAQGSISPGK